MLSKYSLCFLNLFFILYVINSYKTRRMSLDSETNGPHECFLLIGVTAILRNFLNMQNVVEILPVSSFILNSKKLFVDSNLKSYAKTKTQCAGLYLARSFSAPGDTMNNFWRGPLDKSDAKNFSSTVRSFTEAYVFKNFLYISIETLLPL